jgi:vitamin B12 transport system substrate-binding protein
MFKITSLFCKFTIYLIASFTFMLGTSSLGLAKSYQRIVTLSPHATELAFSAGLGNKIVAVSEGSDFPPETANLEKVASYKGIKLEKILALSPDLVIAWPAGNPIRAIEKLKHLGIEIYNADVTHLNGIADNLEALSRYADNPSIGKKNAEQFRQKLNELRTQYTNKKPITYFYQLSEKPIITIAKNSWPSEIFSFCGGVNIFANSPSPYPQVGIEQVLINKPQVIFNSHHAIENIEMWRSWSEIPAVHNHYIWTLNADWMNRPTPRTLKAIKQVCDYLDIARENH